MQILFRSSNVGFAILMFSCAMAVGGCRGDNTGPALPPIEGRYSLEKVGDRMMPVSLVVSSTQRQYLWADTLTLAGGTATESYVYRDSLGGMSFSETRGSAAGAYHVSQDTVIRTLPSGALDTSRVEANGLHVMVNDRTKFFCPTGRCDYFFRRMR